MRFGLPGSIPSNQFVRTEVSETAEKESPSRPTQKLFGLFKQKPSRDTHLDAISQAEIASEAGSLARLLTALTLSPTLEEALMRFYVFLPVQEARRRTSFVLQEMYEILPADVALRLKSISDISVGLLRKSKEAKRPLAEILVLAVFFVVSSAIFALAIVGASTTYSYLSAHLHPFTAGTTANRILRNLFFMVCTCSEHSK